MQHIQTLIAQAREWAEPAELQLEVTYNWGMAIASIVDVRTAMVVTDLMNSFWLTVSRRTMAEAVADLNEMIRVILEKDS
jgi:hypothetical protein